VVKEIISMKIMMSMKILKSMESEPMESVYVDVLIMLIIFELQEQLHHELFITLGMGVCQEYASCAR
jgi:hypothetical protein